MRSYLEQRDKMLDDERKRTIDYIVTKVIEKGKLTFDNGKVQGYDFDLPYCSIGILKTDQEGFEPAIEIVENVYDPDSLPSMDEEECFDSVRILYRGGYDGLSDVSSQGIYFPNADGKALPPAERIIRSNDLLTDQDSIKFDALLKYAQQEL